MEKNKNQIPFPDVCKWLQIFHGLGQVAIELVTKQFTHEGISSHLPNKPPVENRWDSEGNYYEDRG